MRGLLHLATEAELQATVEQLLDLYGYLWHHEVDSRKSKPGMVDILAARPPVLWALELKTAHGRLRPEQLRWAQALAACTTVRYAVVRPADLPRLVEELR